MADGIGRIFGGSSYGVGGYVPQRKNEEEAPEAQAQAKAQQVHEEIKVDPQRVMDFLANNNYFMPVTEAKQASESKDIDAEVKSRIENSMQNFEFVFSVIEKEFGVERAPMIMNIAMDKMFEVVA